MEKRNAVYFNQAKKLFEFGKNLADSIGYHAELFRHGKYELCFLNDDDKKPEVMATISMDFKTYMVRRIEIADAYLNVDEKSVGILGASFSNKDNDLTKLLEKIAYYIDAIVKRFAKRKKIDLKDQTMTTEYLKKLQTKLKKENKPEVVIEKVTLVETKAGCRIMASEKMKYFESEDEVNRNGYIRFYGIESRAVTEYENEWVFNESDFTNFSITPNQIDHLEEELILVKLDDRG